MHTVQIVDALASKQDIRSAGQDMCQMMTYLKFTSGQNFIALISKEKKYNYVKYGHASDCSN